MEFDYVRNILVILKRFSKVVDSRDPENLIKYRESRLDADN